MTVDWTRPIQVEGDARAVRYLGPIREAGGGLKHVVAVDRDDQEFSYEARDDGGLIALAGSRVVNVADPNESQAGDCGSQATRRAPEPDRDHPQFEPGDERHSLFLAFIGDHGFVKKPGNCIPLWRVLTMFRQVYPSFCLMQPRELFVVLERSPVFSVARFNHPDGTVVLSLLGWEFPEELLP